VRCGTFKTLPLRSRPIVALQVHHLVGATLDVERQKAPQKEVLGSRTFANRHEIRSGYGIKLARREFQLRVNSPLAPESLRTIPYLWERPRVGSCVGAYAVTHQKDEEACFQF
jgi:hypothetical protein